MVAVFKELLQEIDPGFTCFEKLQTLGVDGESLKIEDLDSAAMSGKELVLSGHCYCCTAGEGSSCTGTQVA